MRSIISLRQRTALAHADSRSRTEYVNVSKIDPADPVVLLYTSGTAGEPKGCLHSHDAGVSTAATTAALKGLTSDDRCITRVPLFNGFGTVNRALESFIVGAEIVLCRAFEAKEYLRLIETHRVSCFFGTPTMWLRLLEHPDTPGFELSSLRVGMMAGAVPSQELVRTLGTERLQGAAGVRIDRGVVDSYRRASDRGR